MPRRSPKKSLTGLGLGLALTSQAHATADLTPNVHQLGDGLLALLLYIPAGLLLAAVSLEILARREPTSSLHNGVLALLAAAMIGSVIALAAALSVPIKTGALIGSPFASLLTGAAFATMAVFAFLLKGLSLRYMLPAGATAEKPKPRAKKRGRGRGRGKPGRKSKAAGTAAGLAGMFKCFYLASLAAALGCLVASPMFIESSATTISPSLAANQKPTNENADPQPAPVADPLPASQVAPPTVKPPEPEMLAEQDPAPDPEVAIDPPEPAVTAQVEPEKIETPAPVTIEPTVIPTPSPARPTPAARPVVTQTGGLAGADTYKQLIQPLFRSRCYDCHGKDKQKGDLRLDTPEGIRKGGKSGPVIIAGNPDKSYLFELISLDADDGDIMPPKGKPLSESQILWVGGWIREGAALGDGVAWPVPAGNTGTGTGTGTGSAIDAIVGSIVIPDIAATQSLLNSGVIVRKLSVGGELLEIDYSHADRAAGEMRLDELAPLAPNIHTLDLKRTKIADADLEIVATMANLRILHLQRTNITDAAIQHLSALKNLESLNLYNTKVSDASLPELKKLTSLKKLYLWFTAVTPDGARDLASVLGADVVNMGE